MYVIKVPDDVELEDVITEEKIKDKPVTFKQFVIGTLLQDERWRKDLDTIEMAFAIREAARTFGKPGDRLCLEDAHYKELKECAIKPTTTYGNWSPLGMAQLLPFLQAIRDAKKEIVAGKKDAEPATA